MRTEDKERPSVMHREFQWTDIRFDVEKVILVGVVGTILASWFFTLLTSGS